MSGVSLVKFGNGHVSNGTTVSAVYPTGGNTLGNFLIAILSISTWNSGGAFPGSFTYSDTNLQTYNFLIQTPQQTLGSVISQQFIYVVPNCAAGANTVQVTWTGNMTANLDVLELTGPPSSGYLDGSSSNSTQQASVFTGDFSTVNATDLLILTCYDTSGSLSTLPTPVYIATPASLALLFQTDSQYPFGFGTTAVFTQTLAAIGTFAATWSFTGPQHFGTHAILLAFSDTNVSNPGITVLTAGNSAFSGSNMEITQDATLEVGNGNLSGSGEHIAALPSVFVGYGGPAVPDTGQLFPYRIA